MHLGIVIFPTDTTLDPVRLAREVEARGFESLWFPEHSHIPERRATPWGGRPGASPLPEKYWRTHDAFTAFGAAAMVTERLRLGTAITLVAQRDPVWLAKQVATIDHLSGGRFEFGVGFGWNREEMATHGTDPRTRFRRVAESIDLMTAIWTEEVAAYEGDIVSLEPSWSWPKPVQAPRPPVHVGTGTGPKGLDVVFDHADGWMPFGRRFDESMSVFRAEADRRGVDPADWVITAYGVRPEPAALEAVAADGAHRALFDVDSLPPDEVLAELDRLTEVKQAYLGV
jgi:probable F420-dependent oxidoreductase